MAVQSAHDRLQPSLLDRLTDNAPEDKRESADQQTLTMLRLRQAVLRDLAWLLNVTNLATTSDDLPPLVAKSTVNFGIAGITGLVQYSGKRGSLENMLAEAIRAYEPRINPDTLKIRAREQKDDQPVPALVFEIAGELWAQPVPQQLFLETSIELETRLALVTDARAAG
ncbi:MAG TPA: type VI secretion system baseplate subunit TssE [Stellaceae bacterium]|nr:type VI secretion system baseplate subunit TssE [Stellaceae bacterium]